MLKVSVVGTTLPTFGRVAALVSPGALWLAFAVVVLFFGVVLVPAVFSKRRVRRQAALDVFDRIASLVVALVRGWHREL
jgi:hypothetical protein